MLGIRPIEFDVVEAQTDQLRDPEPRGEAEIKHRLVSDPVFACSGSGASRIALISSLVR